jgi:hypothetical protein
MKYFRNSVVFASRTFVGGAFCPAFRGSISRPFLASSPDLQQQVSARGQYRRYRSSHPLFMGWGSNPEWSSATVSSIETATESGAYVKLLLQVNPETFADFEDTFYVDKGLYVQVRLNESTEPLYLKILSASKSNQFEFLVKKINTNEWFTSISANATLQCSQVLGGPFGTSFELNMLEDCLEYTFGELPAVTANAYRFKEGVSREHFLAVVEAACVRYFEAFLRRDSGQAILFSENVYCLCFESESHLDTALFAFTLHSKDQCFGYKEQSYLVRTRLDPSAQTSLQ